MRRHGGSGRAARTIGRRLLAAFALQLVLLLVVGLAGIAALAAVANATQRIVDRSEPSPATTTGSCRR